MSEKKSYWANANSDKPKKVLFSTNDNIPFEWIFPIDKNLPNLIKALKEQEKETTKIMRGKSE